MYTRKTKEGIELWDDPMGEGRADDFQYLGTFKNEKDAETYYTECYLGNRTLVTPISFKVTTPMRQVNV